MSDTVTEQPPGAVLDSAAYPPVVRTLTVVLLIDIVVFGLWALPSLREAEWSTSALALMGLALVSVLWMGYWIVYSRTRLEGDVLTQTWIWNKRAHANEATQLKLVHLPWLQRVMAPRLLVRYRNGGMTWFHSADAELLTAFAHRVAAKAGRPQ